MGPVEGQVNRLRTIKRQMYGRAIAELLRARLIPPTEPPCNESEGEPRKCGKIRFVVEELTGQ